MNSNYGIMEIEKDRNRVGRPAKISFVDPRTLSKKGIPIVGDRISVSEQDELLFKFIITVQKWTGTVVNITPSLVELVLDESGRRECLLKTDFEVGILKFDVIHSTTMN